MKKKLAAFIGFLTLVTPELAFAAETEGNLSSELGWITLIPPALAIILAFATKNVVVSLFIGVFAGTIIIPMAGGETIFQAVVSGFTGFVQLTLNSLADPWNAGIILQVLTIGGLIGLITKMGGARAVAESLTKYAKGPVSTQIITWLMGLLVFFDDYANALIVGPIMRPVADKMRISRERLAFMVDATAAPVAGLALVSTWVGYEIGLINDAFSSIGQEVNAYGVFLETLPYRFYNIFMLFFVLATSVTLREFGTMYQAQIRARDKGKVIADGSEIMTDKDSEEEAPNAKATVWNALLPIGSLIIFSLIGFYANGRGVLLEAGDPQMVQLFESSPFSFIAIREAFGASDASIVLFEAALLSSIIALIMGISQKIFTVSEGIDYWINGMKSLLITGVILLLAWNLSGVMEELGTADFMVSLLGDTMPAILLPTVIFLFGAVIAFATGTAYGTMGILMPLAIPLAAALRPEDPQFAIMAAGSVLSGAIFGDHSSPISDTTILSSMGAGSNHIDHVRTQIPYALFIALMAVIVGYLPTALGLNVWLSLLLGFVVIFIVLMVIGKKVDTTEHIDVT